MGLCLYVFDRDLGDDDRDELAECDVGHDSDFGCFRDTIRRHLDADRYPTLMEHSDCDGEWPLSEMPALEKELREIAARFKKLPPEEPVNAFEHTAEYQTGAEALYDCFHNVSGENLFESLLALCSAAKEHGRPITLRQANLWSAGRENRANECTRRRVMSAAVAPNQPLQQTAASSIASRVEVP